MILYIFVAFASGSLTDIFFFERGLGPTRNFVHPEKISIKALFSKPCIRHPLVFWRKSIQNLIKNKLRINKKLSWLEALPKRQSE